MILQNFLQASRSLAKLDSLRPLCEKVVNEIYLSKLVELTGDPDLPADLIYSAALNFVAPRNPLVLVQGGTLPKNSELAGQKVADFEIGQYPVTLEEWEGVRKWALENGFDISEGSAAALKEPTFAYWNDCLKWCNAKSLMEDLMPIYRIKGESSFYSREEYGSDIWENVVLLTNANGYRLPTEAEWEWAARGGCRSKNYTFAGGNNLDLLGWHTGNSGAVRHPVGQKAPNELGLFDMSGNVLEWCIGPRRWDNFCECFEYPARGGNSHGDPAGCSVSTRNHYTAKTVGCGFRIARSL